MSTQPADGEQQLRPRAAGRRITDRQAAVLALITDGLANKQIAERLGIGEQAVKEHVSHLLRALSVSNRAALAEAATTYRLFGTFELDREWLSALFEGSPVQIAVFTGPDHVFVAANAAYRRAAASQELVGLPFREAFPGLDGTGVYERFDQVFHEQRTIVLHEFPGRFDRRGDGVFDEGHSTIVMHPLPGADQRAGGVAVLAIDVTEQVRERNAAARRSRLRKLDGRSRTRRAGQ